jgi:hypothetical protein
MGKESLLKLGFDHHIDVLNYASIAIFSKKTIA